MVTYNIGSIATDVGNIIGWSNIPSISGTTLQTMATQELNFLNTFTNDGISTDSIAEKYQPSLIDLTMSKVLLAIEATEGGVDNVRIGELSVSQGAGGNAELAKQLRTDAIARLKELGRYVRFKRVIGGC